MTGTVNNLLIKKGIIRGKKIHVGMDNVVPAPKEEAAPVAVEEVTPEITPEPVIEAPVEENQPVVE